MLRASLLITGVVQGVGFRPFCVRTARSLGLCGTVRNTSGGVEVVLEGGEAAILEYLRILREEHPPAAVVSDVQVRRFPVERRTFVDFSVVESRRGAEQRVLIPPDLAICEDCLAEMNDPLDRRHRYPFINCTACGPRYTIIRELPYDRPMTTMRDFPMCPDCEREYHDPADRRYHAQPNACPVCGPKVWLADSSGRTLCEAEEAIDALLCGIAAGRLVAVKGTGGFQIACLPEDGPVGELRRRKHRPDKPFALMVRDPDAARRLVHLSPGAEALLTGTERPVAICPIRDAAPVSTLVAPLQRRLGVMLPSAPLHYLIMERFDVLIMTSANISDSPIVSSNEEAFSTLSGIVDLFLCHNRDIYTPVDDSVVLPADKKNFIFLRRARGYVPNPMLLPFESPDILAAGAQLKSTWSLARGRTLFPGQYLGDLDQLGTATYYRRSLSHFIELYGIEPRVLAFDKHPGYTATELAKGFCGFCGSRENVALCPVQHHHAHLASVLLDNAFWEPAVGVLLDGTGYGDDGTIWGGEFLVGDARGFKRMGSLLPFRLPGGERAIHEPWRCALALLHEAFGMPEAGEIARGLRLGFDAPVDALLAVLHAAPVTTSCGRLFDGVSALLNLCRTATYDGQAAMVLENRSEMSGDALPFDVRDEGDFVLLDWRRAVRALVSTGADSVGKTAGAFHGGLSLAICDACDLLRRKTGLKHAALSGGVWQNRLLLDLSCRELENRGFTVLTHKSVSPNDEGVSVGQAVVAAHFFHVARAHHEKTNAG
ncbi:MAG: carbamoyltransferase HypF [Synergistaceae bacterium]|nr:carbamoyltransferase HypF [Synergistaceae bacterium]